MPDPAVATPPKPPASPALATPPIPAPDEEFAKAGEENAKAQQEFATRSAELTDQRAKQIKENIAQEKADEPSADIKYKDAPDEQLPEVRPPVEALLKWLPMLAVLGASASRTASHGALRAAIGVMQGQQQGDLDARDRAHSDYLDQMKKLEEDNKVVSQKLDDAWKKIAIDRDSGVAALNAINAEYDLAKDQAAVASGNYKMAHDIFTARETAAKNVAEAHHNNIDEQLAVARLNQGAAEQAQNRQQHRDDMEMRLNEMGDARRTQLALHERDALDKLPQVKAWDLVQGTQKFVDDAIAGKIDLSQRANQIALLDAFTKRATGGQAIRGFMLKAASDQLGLQADADKWASQLTKPQAKLMSSATLKGFLDGAKILGDDMTRAYGDVLRERAPVYQANEIPLGLIFTPDEQKLIQPAAAPTAAGNIAPVTTKAEFDALPKGAWYSKPGDPPNSHREKQ